MNHRPVASGRDRYLAGGSIVGIVALVLVALWLSPLRVDAAPVALNPMAAAGDFTVKTEGDARFDGVEVEGSLAIGGDYTFVGGLPIIHSSGLTPAGYAIPVIDEDPTRLLVRGTFDTAGSSGVSELSSRGNTGEGQLGYVKIGQVGDLQVSARGENNVWIADGPSGAEPGIYDPNQPFSDDPTPAEGSRVQLSETGWDDYFDSLDNTDDVTSCLAELEQNTLIEAGDDANQVQIPITEGVTNVLEVTPDSPLFSAVSVALTAELGPATTLVIKVVDAAGATLTVPRFEAANDTSATNPNVLAPYLLWDLSANAGSPVELTGDKISGSVYAPGVDLTLSQSSPFEGTIISETLHTEASSGELHHYRFLGTIQCEEATPSPTPTSTPTESPSSHRRSRRAPPRSRRAPRRSRRAPDGVAERPDGVRRAPSRSRRATPNRSQRRRRWRRPLIPRRVGRGAAAAGWPARALKPGCCTCSSVVSAWWSRVPVCFGAARAAASDFAEGDLSEPQPRSAGGGGGEPAAPRG